MGCCGPLPKSQNGACLQKHLNISWASTQVFKSHSESIGKTSATTSHPPELPLVVPGDQYKFLRAVALQKSSDLQRPFARHSYLQNTHVSLSLLGDHISSVFWHYLPCLEFNQLFFFSLSVLAIEPLGWTLRLKLHKSCSSKRGLSQQDQAA